MKHRQNRYDPGDPVHQSVRNNPGDYTRASRRAAGQRRPVHADAMREFHGRNRVLPRAVRRLFRDPLKAEKRVRLNTTKVNRLLDRFGMASK